MGHHLRKNKKLMKQS